MPFPESERIFYDKNSLESVICQLRFPPILKINSEPPFEFQEAIREDYPLFNEQTEHSQTIIVDGNLSNLGSFSNSRTDTNKNFSFSSIDNNWHINLTHTFISLSTSNYKTWEEFLDKFRNPLDKFYSLYKPAFIERIGLRYIDVFDRAELELDKPWSEYIKPFALGIMGEKNVEDNIKTYNSITEIMLADAKSYVRVATSLVQRNDNDSVKGFRVDSDFYDKEKFFELDTIYEKLDFLHIRASRLLQWIIKPKLHIAMKPRG